MSPTSENLHPIDGKTVPQIEKENLLAQRGMVFWMTGLSGSGKSTLALNAEKQLHQTGRLVKLLDGDNIRGRLNSNLGFSIEDRRENIRRVAEVARLFRECGVITICSFICPTIEIRQMARETVGADYFREIYVSADLAACESRDPKGLYKKARAGQIPDFTGIHSPYEAPPSPDLTIETAQAEVEESAQKLLNYILQESRI
jgi:adenylylsulfate kinase